MMKRIAWLLMLLTLLCGCTATGLHPTETQGNAVTTMRPTFPTIPTSSVLATTLPTIPTSIPTETVGPAPVVNMYAGAIADYLLPLETYSDERQFAPEMVMIHFSSAVQIDEKDPYNMDLIRNIFVTYEVSTHYIIDRDGTIRCYIPEDRVAWHAGKGSWPLDDKYTNAMNQYAIGIELVAMGSKKDMSPYMSGKEYDAMDQSLMGFTPAQYDALSGLVRDLCLRYGIPMDRDHIIGHKEYAPKKPDPGELFDWAWVLGL